MTLDIPLHKTKAGQQALSFLGSKIWIKIRQNTMDVKITAIFTQALMR